MASIPTNSQLSAFLKTLRALKSKPYERGFSLPGAFYTDPSWTQTECSELFAKDWVCVGRVEEVARPGDFFAFDHIGEPLLVVHGRDGVNVYLPEAQVIVAFHSANSLVVDSKASHRIARAFGHDKLRAG